MTLLNLPRAEVAALVAGDISHFALRTSATQRRWP